MKLTIVLIYTIGIILAYEHYAKKYIVKYYNLVYDWIVTKYNHLKELF